VRERNAGKGVPLAQLPVNPGELRGGLFRLSAQRVVLAERLPHLGQPAEHRLERRGRDQVDLLPDQRPQPRFPEVAEVLRRELRQQRLLLLQRLRIRLVLRAGGLLPLPCERLAVRFLEVEFPFEVFPVLLQLLLRCFAFDCKLSNTESSSENLPVMLLPEDWLTTIITTNHISLLFSMYFHDEVLT